MQKESLVKYFEGQLKKIDQPDFDLNSWKSVISAFLEQVFGRGNAYAAQIQSLQYVETMSYEELYPKKIRDTKASLANFKNTIKEMIDQFSMQDDKAIEEFTNRGSLKGTETLTSIIEALRNNLTGKQFAELKQTASDFSELNYLIKKMDAEILRNLLADILSCKEIWENTE